MKLPNRAIIAWSVAFIFAGAAYASDAFIADCEEFKATNGIEGDCKCMAEKASEASVADELEATTTLDDLDGLSEAAKAVVDACT